MFDLASVGIVANPHGRAEQRGPCPQCSNGKRDDTLGCNVERGVWHCFRCGWKGRIGGEAAAPVHPITRFDDPAIVERKKARLRETWQATVSLTHEKAHAVRSYLCARGLAEILKRPPRVLRAHPRLMYWDGTRELGTFPALIALLHGATGDPVTLHVTYLRPDGCAKAAVPNQKKILGVPVRGATKGGAIHLHEPRNGLLGIAEGIESALSLHLMQDVPVWSAYCADNLERVRLPRGLRQLIIAVDVDANGRGERAAQALAKRATAWRGGPKVTLMRPDEGFEDLNAELMRRRAG